MAGGRRHGILVLAALLPACQAPPPAPPPVTPPASVAPAAPVPRFRPFDRAWFAPGLDLEAYSEVDLAPVDASRLGPRAQEQARALEAALAAAIRTYPGGHRLALVEAPGPETLVVELALLDVRGGGSALEGRARDGATGRVVARFADRESDAPAGGEGAIEAWAAQLAEILETGGGELVEETGPFALRAWPESDPRR